MIEGIFAGQVTRNRGIPKREVQYGPLVIPKIPDPVDDIVTRTIGEIPYEANGVVEWRPERIGFIGS